MEAFSISCTTCKSRLKVYDEAVIGEILSCPKCSSMVLVQAPESRWRQPAPEEQVPEQQAVSASAAVGSSSVSSLLDEPASEPQYPATYVETKPPPLPHGDRSTLNDPESSAVLPGSQWSSAATRKRLMMAAGALVGVVMAIGMFAIVIAVTRDDAVPNQILSTDDRPADGEAKDAATGPTPLQNDPLQPSADPIDKDEFPIESKLPEETDPTPQPPPNDSDPPLVPLVDEPPVSDPIDESPPGLEPSDAVADASGGNPRSLLKDLEAFGELLDNVGFEFSGDGSDADDPLPSDFADDEPLLEKPEPRAVDVEARLADKFLGIQFQDVPLDAYLQDLSDLSTLPITLDPEALAWAKLSPDHLVGVTLTDAKVSDMLSAVLEPFLLAVVASEGHVRITWPGSELREAEYEVDDLIGGDPNRLAQLQKMAQQLVAANSWKEPGGLGSMRIDENRLIVSQTAAIHDQLLVFFEKLRVARGLPTTSSYDEARFQVATRHERAQAKLSTPISMNYIQPARLVEILRQIHQDTKMHVLVDWQATSETGWTHDTEVPFSADEQPLEEALAGLLRRMGLTYRIVDADVLQITTPQILAESTDFEIYPAADLLSERVSRDQLVDGLKTALGAPHFFDGAGAMIFDEPSASLLVTLPQPQQGSLAKLLESLRAGK